MVRGLVEIAQGVFVDDVGYFRILKDDNGEQHRFFFETFFNRYDALTLGVYIALETRIYNTG